jgi:hypothetical protein
MPESGSVTRQAAEDLPPALPVAPLVIDQEHQDHLAEIAREVRGVPRAQSVS